MSRSYKKQPIVHSGGWMSKTKANRIVRAKVRNISANDDASLPQNNYYRKFVEQYEINDFVSYYPIEAARKDYQTTDHLRNKYPDDKTFLGRHWAKNYRRK